MFDADGVPAANVSSDVIEDFVELPGTDFVLADSDVPFTLLTGDPSVPGGLISAVLANGAGLSNGQFSDLLVLFAPAELGFRLGSVQVNIDGTQTTLTALSPVSEPISLTLFAVGTALILSRSVPEPALPPKPNPRRCSRPAANPNPLRGPPVARLSSGMRSIASVVGLLLVVGCQPAPQQASNDPAVVFKDDDIIIREEGEPSPAIVYNEFVHRTGDADLDNFLRRFVSVGLAGNYSQYRLMFTYTEEPRSIREFTLAWQAVERIEVTGVRPLTPATQPGTAQGSTTPPSGGWLVTLQATLRAAAAQDGARQREVRFVIAREGPQNVYRARQLPDTQ